MFFVKWKGWRYLFVLLSLAFALQFVPSGNVSASTLSNRGQSHHSCGINFTGSACHIHVEDCGKDDKTGDPFVGIYQQAFDGSDSNFNGQNQVCLKGEGTFDLDQILTPDGQLWGQAVSGLNSGGSGVLADDSDPQHFLGFKRSQQFSNLKNIPLLDGSGDWNDRGRFLTLYSPY